MTQAVAIMNPRAGVAARAALAALQAAGGRFKGLEIRTTERRGHARDLARQAADEGRELVVACGGDGTVNEVGWGLMETPVVLALVPAGSGNGLGRALGIPRNPARALLALATAEPHAMDVGMVNDKPFLNVAGAGFDAAVGEAYDHHGRRTGRRGLLNYFKVGIQTAWGYQCDEFALEAGDLPSGLTKFLLVAFANGQQYGGGALIAPRARLDDGLLDVVGIEDDSLARMLWHAPLMPLGRIAAYRKYRHVAARSAVLTGTRPIAYHRDGEPEPPTERLEARIVPGALKVLVPAATIAAPAGPFAADPERATGPA
jgi:YegS/Rv2252/BmrU family lipid kinase